MLISSSTGRKTNANGGKSLTCIYCRAPWAAPGAAGGARGAGAVVRTAEGYINLAGVAGVSPQRDTSTCEFDFSIPLEHLVLPRHLHVTIYFVFYLVFSRSGVGGLCDSSSFFGRQETASRLSIVVPLSRFPFYLYGSILCLT